MVPYQWDERLVERQVTYVLDLNGELIVVENVPARVNLETGEQLFSPETVEHLQKIVWERRTPKRVIQVPVYEYAEV
ncbi:MAG: YgiT-type zinc finger protein [Anaerolineae bacterium]|nr:YgiT-type zinc finger protein [Anaerolineae bacterium]MCX8068652.1 YgiT-type zinc finger protein [Anaerolineae bacterium]